MRRSIHAVVATFIALVAIATTATSARSAFSYGTIQSSCAPWDFPAIGITLTSEPAQCKRTREPFVSMGRAGPASAVRRGGEVRPGVGRRLCLTLQERRQL